MLFQKWIPIDNLGIAYDVENITYGNTISFTLIADKKRGAQDNVHRLQLSWESSHIISYHVTDETYRSDCWKLDYDNNGRFYIIKNSRYIEQFKEKSPLFPDNAIHFLIVGTNTIVDVLAISKPSVMILG